MTKMLIWTHTISLMVCLAAGSPNPSCPMGRPSPNFHVIGHAGGDPVRHCENTIPATLAALDQGANVIELDLCMSRDGHIFLWHDPDPRDPLSIARRHGIGLPGKCSPRVTKVPSEELSFQDILHEWHHVDRESRSLVSIESFDNWLVRFRDEPRIDFIWLDIKVKSSLGTFFTALEQILRRHSFPAEKLLALSLGTAERAVTARALMSRIFSSHSVLQPSLVVEDVTSNALWLSGHVGRFNAFAEGVPMCGTLVNLGAPPIALNRWDSIQKIVKFNVQQRNRFWAVTGRYIQVFVWTIDSEPEMRWLLKSGIDGIITNRPGLLRSLSG